jgi:hypothetical protein
MNELDHIYDGAIRLAVPFVERALAAGEVVRAESIAEQAVHLAWAIDELVRVHTASRRALPPDTSIGLGATNETRPLPTTNVQR